MSDGHHLVGSVVFNLYTRAKPDGGTAVAVGMTFPEPVDVFPGHIKLMIEQLEKLLAGHDEHSKSQAH